MRNLITAQEVIDLAFAENSNMMAESISDTAIRIAEIKYIRPAFGAMYPLLADKYADFTNDYVKPALAYFVKCEIVSSIAIDMSNSGVAVANPQYQSAATDKQRQRLYDSEMSKAKTLLDFALEYIATHSESFPDFSGEAPKKHHRVGGILLGGGTSRNQSASIAGEAFKAEFDKYIKEMGETAEEVEQLIESTGAITEEAKKATNNANIATESAQEATENANNAGAEAVRIATESAQEATTAKENAEQATEQAKEATANANSAAQRANEEVQNLREKADTNGYYPSMTVGKSDNLVGRGDVQDATINFRPSGGVPDVGNGMNITDGTARIKAIKGNSVVYNQIHKYTSRTVKEEGLALTFATEKGLFFIKGTKIGVSTNVRIYSFYNANVIEGHKYLFFISDIISNNTRIEGVYIYGAFAGIYCNQDAILQADSSRSISSYISILANEGETVDIVGRAPIIDLTKEFGAGNEPKTVAEYYQRKPINIENEFAYNEGELLDMKVDELVSVGDNAYNPIEHKARVIGGQKYHITDGANTEDLEVTFYAFNEDENEERNIEPIIEDGKKYYIFPANGYCIVNGQVGNVCVCLEHSYEKPIKPFEQDIKDLSFIREITDSKGNLLFPNGMRSAGSAYDEIRYDVTKKKWVAIKRIADRVYQDEDKNDSNLTTDGETTNYELATPIVVEIPNSENWNLDYLVWDFGTEEALERDSTIDSLIPSAPFRAEINYEPNAVDDLRWSIKYIRALEQRVLALEQKVAQEANIEEV